MSDIFGKFNGLSDKERYDIINSLQGSLEDANWSNESSPMVAIKTDANWEWGVSGAGRPHSELNLVGTLTLSDRTDQYDRQTVDWSTFAPPDGRRTGQRAVNVFHFAIMADEASFAQRLEQAYQEMIGPKLEAIAAQKEVWTEVLRVAKEKGWDLEDYNTNVKLQRDPELGELYREAKFVFESEIVLHPREEAIPQFLQALKDAPMNVNESIDLDRWARIAGLLKG